MLLAEVDKTFAKKETCKQSPLGSSISGQQIDGSYSSRLVWKLTILNLQYRSSHQ